MSRSKDVTPAEDYGFFGPGSITWKVWGYPTSLTVGLQRAVVVEEMDPALVAAVTETHGIYDRPRTRYDRTVRYFAMVAFGDSRSTSKVADVLVKVHSRAVGIEPYSGAVYDANDPRSQLWILLTGWHSVLHSYEKYGPGKLTPEEDARYWAECAVAAELQTCDPADVPRDSEGVRAYFERMRPQLSASEYARNAMNHLLNGEAALPPVPAFARPLAKLVSRALRAATLATMPRWMREAVGIHQSRLVDALITPGARTVFRLLHVNRRVELRLLRFLSPGTFPVAAPALAGVPAVNPAVLTPAEARERYGYDKPAEAHLELRRRQRDRALAGTTPSDDVIRDSQPVLGPIA
ncbi:DUF2236 domain-containing protein [Amycolatopsis sp. NBC_00345]|uniref:oxygenase MpaB family protein n=1 Tax=Amycolatopsis sp. NBC_00345 TaxID=2975955 RepID=UPI002E257734